MTGQELLDQLPRHGPAPLYLFLGPDAYLRRVCRQKLIESWLAPEDRESGVRRHDLDEISLAAVLEDANAASLFAPRRLLWAGSAEAALPKGKAAEEAGSAAELLARYARNPSPDVVLVFDCSRYRLEGEDRARVERVRKFYAPIREVVEFPHFSPQAAQALARQQAAEAGLRIAPARIAMLVEACGADAARVAAEIEKLSLFVGRSREVTPDDIAALVPDARQTTIFALVAAVGRRDRREALELLETLMREGEYLPLALNFLAGQFRLALVARELGLRNAAQIQSHFQGAGVPMWRSKAEQVLQTATAFPPGKLEAAICRTFAADRALRDTRPDDRIVMEEYILALTS